MSDPAASASDFEFEALQHARNYRQALIEEFTPFLKGEVLEVGAGVGQLTGLLARLPAVRHLVAVEPQPQFHERLCQVLPEKDVVKGTARAVRQESWDAIVCVNVLEHIEDDAKELAVFFALLRNQRGFLCLFVPARRELYAPIDRDFGHYRRYTRRELAAKLEQAGFLIDRLSYFNSVGYLLWWLNFRVLKKRRFEPGKVALFDRFIFPLVHTIESRFIRPPLGQSLLAVARAAS